MWNIHQLFVLCSASQVIGGDFAKFCGLLRIYELYHLYSYIFRRYFLSLLSYVFGKNWEYVELWKTKCEFIKVLAPFLWALNYVASYHRSLLKQITTLFCSGGFILVPSFLSLIDILFSSSSIKKVGWYFETIEWQRNWIDLINLVIK